MKGLGEQAEREVAMIDVLGTPQLNSWFQPKLESGVLKALNMYWEMLPHYRYYCHSLSLVPFIPECGECS
jgi:hypothetical protein